MGVVGKVPFLFASRLACLDLGPRNIGLVFIKAYLLRFCIKALFWFDEVSSISFDGLIGMMFDYLLPPSATLLLGDSSFSF